MEYAFEPLFRFIPTIFFLFAGLLNMVGTLVDNLKQSKGGGTGNCVPLFKQCHEPVDYLFMKFCETFQKAWMLRIKKNRRGRYLEICLLLTGFCILGTDDFIMATVVLQMNRCSHGIFKIYLHYGSQTASVANAILSMP